MKTKNQFRKSKMQEIEQIKDMYPDLKPHEQLFMVIDELSRKAERTGDHTQLASIQEHAKLFSGLFINPKTGRPIAEAINWINKLVSKIRRDKAHPHIRPYTELHGEIDVSGTEVFRYYLNLLRGSRAVTYVNNRLEAQREGIKVSQKQNQELANVRRVMKEAEKYRVELEEKQQEANSRKRRKK